MHALALIAVVLAADGGVEVVTDGGRCSYQLSQTGSKCHYEGKSATYNRETEKWRNREFEGDLPCGRSAQICGKKLSCDCAP